MARHDIGRGAPLVLALALTAERAPTAMDDQRPPHASQRFSELTQITPANVERLAVAWTAHTGELAGGLGPRPPRPVEGFQTRPVLVGDLLVVTTTTSKVIALDAEQGAERWRFDPFASRARDCERPHRGVALWQDAASGRRTIFSGTCDGRLVALDPATGTLRSEFADRGVLDLKPGAGARPGEAFGITSPPAVFRDLIVVGALVPEGTPDGPSGDVRAFEALTGREVWRFHTVPRKGEDGHDTWPQGGTERRTGVNVWSAMSVDEARGLVFLPVGSASYDFYGGDRAGDNLYSSSLVTLDAATGQRRWHAQLVHHDLWDYDPPAQPVLVDIARPEGTVPAVVQVTKMGLVFVFDRTSGAPVFGVVERPVPRSAVPGEASAPTQPFPVKPPPLVRTTALTRSEVTTVTQRSREECLALFDSGTSGGLYTPSGLEPTLWFPGTMGGATWSGAAVDPARGLLFVNTNEVGAIAQMAPAPAGAPIRYRRTSPTGEYGRFWDSDQLPCQQPPWGRLHAIDLRSGEIAWQVPLGEAPQLGGLGVTGTGTLNLGGAVVTATGLVFIAATNDSVFRAFDAESGRVLWSATLPAAGHATPTIYRGPRSGRQLVVVAAGGGGRFSKTVADAVVAFALQEDR